MTKTEKAREWLKANPKGTPAEAKAEGFNASMFYKVKREMGGARNGVNGAAKTNGVAKRHVRKRAPAALRRTVDMIDMKLFLERVASNRSLPRDVRFEAWELLNP